MNFLKTKLTALILFVVLIGWLAGGCGTEPREYICYRKVIPDSLKMKAAERLESILGTVKVQSRVDDEDVEDWIYQAEKTIIELYGVMEVGIGDKDNWQSFTPYAKCSDEQKKWIDKYLNEQR